MGHGALLSLGERDTPPENQKLAASRYEPPLVAPADGILAS